MASYEDEVRAHKAYREERTRQWQERAAWLKRWYDARMQGIDLETGLPLTDGEKQEFELFRKLLLTPEEIHRNLQIRLGKNDNLATGAVAHVPKRKHLRRQLDPHLR